MTHESVCQGWSYSAAIHRFERWLGSNRSRGRVATGYQRFTTGDQGEALYVLFGHDREAGLAGLKFVTYAANTPRMGTVRARIVLYDTQSDRLLLSVEASQLTAMRTAAVSAVAIKRLTPRRGLRCGFIGTGRQATAHLEAIPCVATVRNLSVVGRTKASVDEFAATAKRLGYGNISTGLTPEELVRQSDVVVAATTSDVPVIRGRWLQPGQLVVSVASRGIEYAEVDVEAIRDSITISDDLVSARRECGDFLAAYKEGIRPEEAPQFDLRDVMAGALTFEEMRKVPIVYKSIGSFEYDYVAIDLLMNESDEFIIGGGDS